MLKLNVLACFYMSSGKKESYKMNSFNIDNSNIKVSTGVNSSLKATNTTSGSKTVSVQMTDTNKLALLKKLNITSISIMQLKRKILILIHYHQLNNMRLLIIFL